MDVWEWATVYEDARDTLAVLASNFPPGTTAKNNDLFGLIAAAWEEAKRGAEEWGEKADAIAEREMKELLREYWRSVM